MLRRDRRPAATAGMAVAVALSTLLTAACTSAPTTERLSTAGPDATPGTERLTVLIGASNEVELNQVRAATSAWASTHHATVEVTAAAKLTDELAKAFAAGQPPDLFYLDPASLGQYAEDNKLYPYGDQVADLEYLAPLVKAFTYDGRFYCAPKDFSSLALVINAELWAQAGLTDADLPKTWADLESVARRLTQGDVTGLVFSGERDRVGAFLRQAGGWWVGPDGRTPAFNSAANLTALTQIRKLLESGVAQYASQVDAGWGGEALVRGRAAMVIEGNWIRGALAKDAPQLKVKVAELPAGPAGKGTLVFTNCWGIPASSPRRASAVSLVKYLGTTTQQLTAARAFGVMPSTTDAYSAYRRAYPQDAAFAAGAAYGQHAINAPDLQRVLSELDAQLELLPEGDAKLILDGVQRDAEEALRTE